MLVFQLLCDHLGLNVSFLPPPAPQNDSTGFYSHLAGVPKALLPGVGGKKILDFWWETVNMCVSSQAALPCSVSLKLTCV